LMQYFAAAHPVRTPMASHNTRKEKKQLSYERQYI